MAKKLTASQAEFKSRFGGKGKDKGKGKAGKGKKLPAFLAKKLGKKA